MYSAILVHALINFAPPKRRAGFTKQDELRKRAGISGKDRQSKASIDRVDLVGLAAERRSTMTMYLILGHSHCIPMVDLIRL